MNNKVKEYIFILYICLLPVTVTLLSLKLNNVGYFNTKPYFYIISLFTIILLITFVMSCLIIIDDILKKEEFSTIKNFKIACLLLFSLFYPPIHYLFNYQKKFCFISFIFIFLDILSLVYFSKAFNNYVVRLDTKLNEKEISLTDHYDYYFDKNDFKLNIDMDYSCNAKLGDYVLSCEDKKTDSFVGIYSYILDNYSEDELEDIYEYHLKQTIGYIEDEGYTFESNNIDSINVINYNNMTIYMSYVDYDLNHDGNKDKRLIIIYETSINDINNYFNLINGIKVNYNNK